MEISELAAKLTEVHDKLTEAATEIVAEIQALKDAIAAADDVPAEVAALVDSLDAKATALADIIPDAPPAEPAPE